MVFAEFALYRRSCSDLLLIIGDLDLSSAILGHLGAVLGHLGAVFGHLGPSWCPSSWAVLGPSWAILGPSWGLLGAVMGLLGAILAPSFDALGPSGAIVAHLGAILAAETGQHHSRNRGAAGPFAQRNSIRPHSVRSARCRQKSSVRNFETSKPQKKTSW